MIVKRVRCDITVFNRVRSRGLFQVSKVFPKLCMVDLVGLG